jgi:hypothetical protein
MTIEVLDVIEEGADLRRVRGAMHTEAGEVRNERIVINRDRGHRRERRAHIIDIIVVIIDIHTDIVMGDHVHHKLQRQRSETSPTSMQTRTEIPQNRIPSKPSLALHRLRRSDPEVVVRSPRLLQWTTTSARPTTRAWMYIQILRPKMTGIKH